MAKPTDLVEELRKRFAVLADIAPVMIWTSGTDKLCDFVNGGWLRFTGRTMAQELANGWTEGVHPDDLDHCIKIYSESFDARRPFTMEYRLRRHDGAYRWVLENGVPRQAPSGQFAGYIGSCIDIHEQRESREHLEQALEQQQELVREIHHRVRNSLQLAVSLISNARRRFEEQAVRDELSGVQQRLLSMARIYDKVFRGTTQRRLELGEHIGEIAEALREARIRDGVCIEVDVERLPVHIEVAISVSLIVTELLMNALRHAFPGERGGTVRVTLRDGAEAHLVVSDDGPGNAAEADRHALSLVQLLTMQLKGRLDVERGAGTRFTLSFNPRSEGDEATQAVA